MPSTVSRWLALVFPARGSPARVEYVAHRPSLCLARTSLQTLPEQRTSAPRIPGESDFTSLLTPQHHKIAEPVARQLADAYVMTLFADSIARCRRLNRQYDLVRKHRRRR